VVCSIRNCRVVAIDLNTFDFNLLNAHIRLTLDRILLTLLTRKVPLSLTGYLSDSV